MAAGSSGEVEMLVGVPREIKDNEFRVGLTPSAVRELVEHGHKVIVETGAGEAIDLEDGNYRAAGAEIVPDAAAVFGRAELVVKVKEPQPVEISMLRAGQVLFTYLHLAPDRAQTEGLLSSGCIAIAYETVSDERGGLPLLAPMSEVAGRMSIQAGAHALEREAGAFCSAAFPAYRRPRS
jgi:alanine dehydrogenase